MPKCEVANTGCLLPAAVRCGSGVFVPPGTTRLKCFSCGSAVCSACSRLRRWFKWRSKRICDNCHEFGGR